MTQSDEVWADDHILHYSEDGSRSSHVTVFRARSLADTVTERNESFAYSLFSTLSYSHHLAFSVFSLRAIIYNDIQTHALGRLDYCFVEISLLCTSIIRSIVGQCYYRISAEFK